MKPIRHCSFCKWFRDGFCDHPKAEYDRAFHNVLDGNCTVARKLFEAKEDRP